MSGRRKGIPKGVDETHQYVWGGTFFSWQIDEKVESKRSYTAAKLNTLLKKHLIKRVQEVVATSVGFLATLQYMSI